MMRTMSVLALDARRLLSTVLAVPLLAGAAATQHFGPETCAVPTLATTHPRLWLADAPTLARLKAAAQANSAEWQDLKGFCDSHTLPDFAYQGDQQYRYVANFGLCYRMVKEISGASAAATYAQKAVAVLQGAEFPLLAFTDYGTDDGYGIRNYVPAMALAYDWLADSPELTVVLKAAIVTRIQAWLAWYATDGYSNGSDAYFSNYNSGYMLARTLWAIAVYGEDATASATWSGAVDHYQSAIDQFDTEYPGGHWCEGWNYGAGVYERYLMSGTALKVFTNDASYLGSPWLQNNVLFKLGAISPDGSHFLDDGLWSGDAAGVPSANDMSVAGYAFGWGSTRGKMARSYINQAIAGGNAIDFEEWKRFLFYDPASQPYDLTTLPKSYLATGSGVVTMRSDWTAAGGTWLSLTSGGRYLSYQGEQDMDQGHVSLYRRAQLLIDVAHNIYGDPGQADTWMHNSITMEGRVDDAYSGQRDLSFYCPNPLGSDPIGNRRYSEGGTYAFASGEFSAAYQVVSGDPCSRVPATWVSRSVFYLRPGLFVLYDQVKKAGDQPTLTATLHMHFPTSPTASSSNRVLTVDNGGGRLHFATVLPANSANALAFEPVDADNGPGIENYHLKVSYPTAGVAYQNFVNVLRAGDATGSYVAPATSAITGSSSYGALVSGLLAAESATPVAVVFADNQTTTPPSALSYSYASATPAFNYVALLKPNTRYTASSSISAGTVTITVTENSAGIATDGAGVLAFPQ